MEEGAPGSSPEAPPLQLSPRATLSRSPYPGPRLQAVCRPLRGVGPHGVSLGSGGWVPPWLCAPASSWEELAASPKGVALHLPTRLGGWRITSQPRSAQSSAEGACPQCPIHASQTASVPSSGASMWRPHTGLWPGAHSRCLAGLTREEESASQPGRDQKGLGLTLQLRGVRPTRLEGPGPSRESSGFWRPTQWPKWDTK